MSFMRNQFSGPMIWSVIALTLWVGNPSTACQCANGNIKLFCDAHKQSHENEPTGHSPAVVVDCCQNVAIGQTTRIKRTLPSGRDVSSQGCTRISSAAVTLPTQTSVEFAPVYAAGSPIISLESSSLLAAIAAAPAEPIDTGPPRDLVIAFHCFLI